MPKCVSNYSVYSTRSQRSPNLTGDDINLELCVYSRVKNILPKKVQSQKSFQCKNVTSKKLAQVWD